MNEITDTIIFVSFPTERYILDWFNFSNKWVKQKNKLDYSFLSSHDSLLGSSILSHPFVIFFSLFRKKFITNCFDGCEVLYPSRLRISECPSRNLWVAPRKFVSAIHHKYHPIVILVPNNPADPLVHCPHYLLFHPCLAIKSWYFETINVVHPPY